MNTIVKFGSYALLLAICIIMVVTAGSVTERKKISCQNYLEAEDFWYEHKEDFTDYREAEAYFNMYRR